MWARLKSIFYRYVPTHVGNPFGLVRRMISSGNRAALFTLFVAALGIVCIPLDMLLSIRERRLIASAGPTPTRPVIFVCGPARSGTTLVFQVLCRYLDVSYVQNVTALFPRSPVTVTRMYRRLFGLRKNESDSFHNYYGKTAGMYGPSEANHIWNRWVEPDATGFRTTLSDAGAQETAHFFAAFGRIDDKAIVAKNNNMNVFADVVAAAIPESVFICLRRDTAFLAQSLLQARRDIRGTVSDGYGVQDTERRPADTDPVAAVCEQILFLERKAKELQSRIGERRFWIVDYEEFCQDPHSLVSRLSTELGVTVVNNLHESRIRSVPVHNVIRDKEEMQRIRTYLHSLGSNPGTAKS